MLYIGGSERLFCDKTRQDNYAHFASTSTTLSSSARWFILLVANIHPSTLMTLQLKPMTGRASDLSLDTISLLLLLPRATYYILRDHDEKEDVVEAEVVPALGKIWRE